MITSLDLTNRMTCELMQTVNYFDGLGRPLQTVQVMASPNNRDIVQPVAFDQFGRETKKYLPYIATAASSGGSFKANALAEQSSFYASPSSTTWNAPGVVTIPLVNGISPAYSQTVFEPSPLSRVTEQGAPGAPWQPNVNSDLSHTTRIEYTTNDLTNITTVASTYKVMKYSVALAEDGMRTLVNASTTAYSEGQLYVTVIKDENWQTTDGRAGTMQEFKDKGGHIVLKRVFNRKSDNAIEMLSTYYVYDAIGNLCFVLPPGALPDGGTISAAARANLCYQYSYDKRNRLIERQIPGKGKELMVYNSLDQLVMSQDALQRNTNNQQWLVTKYDALGRVAVIGLYTHSGSQANLEYREQMQTAVDAVAKQWEERVAGGNGYNTSAFLYQTYPTTLNTTLSVNYYDNYNIPNLPAAFDKHLEAGMSTMTGGMPTASLTKVLDGTTGSTNMLWSASYYDDEGRNIRGFSQHFKGGVVSLNNYDEVVNTYSFTNAPLSSTRKNYINVGSSPLLSITVKTNYDYDHAGRKTNTWEEINGNKTLLSRLVYNELGELKDKKLHSLDQGATFVQSVDYRYNSRGWVRSINNASLTNDGVMNDDGNDAFGMQLSYEDYPITALKQYNGNISAVSWQSKVPSNSGVAQILQSFEYNYDRIDRLTKSQYTTPGLISKYNEEISYDMMGNIKTLSRYMGSASTPIDNLLYNYEDSDNSNRLLSVTDNSGDNTGQLSGTSMYLNYVNGNLKYDEKKLLTLTYNHLNLPQTITKTGVGSINYIYDANGQKLRKVFTGANRDYVRGIEYDNAGTLVFIQTEEGRARPNGTSYFYEYMLKDHLGNTRVMIGQDGVIGQNNDYYAFGMEIHREEYIVPSPDNNYKYNGKELQGELGLNHYDYGARFYDPVLARWGVPDPLAERHFDFSPYSYVLNNPLLYVDPFGLDTAYSDIKSRDMVRKYSDPFIRDKQDNLTNKKNRSYNEEFAKIISRQAEAKETYKYAYDVSGSRGEVSYDGKNINITLADPGEQYGAGADGILFEEVKHTEQFMDGKTYFGITDGKWGSYNDLSLEYQAKMFVIDQLSINRTLSNDGLNIPTQLGFLLNNKKDPAKGMLFLLNGLTNYSVYGLNGKVGVVDVAAPYPKLRGLEPFHNIFKERTQNATTFGYPTKQ